MSEQMADGLKRAEQYFLEMACGSQEGEDFALAEVCNRAADRIEELEAEVKRLRGAIEEYITPCPEYETQEPCWDEDCMMFRKVLASIK